MPAQQPLTRDEILNHIPHRPPFLFLDRVIDVQVGQSIQAAFFLDPTASYFEGHFPGNPVMPGALMLEALAQATCVLFDMSFPSSQKRSFYAGSVKVRFLKPVRPGCVIELYSKSVSMISRGGVFEVSVEVEGEKFLTGEIGCMCVYES